MKCWRYVPYDRLCSIKYTRISFHWELGAEANEYNFQTDGKEKID